MKEKYEEICSIFCNENIPLVCPQETLLKHSQWKPCTKWSCEKKLHFEGRNATNSYLKNELLKSWCSHHDAQFVVILIHYFKHHTKVAAVRTHTGKQYIVFTVPITN